MTKAENITSYPYSLSRWKRLHNKPDTDSSGMKNDRCKTTQFVTLEASLSLIKRFLRNDKDEI